ncbi:immunity protein Imm33 domain-containing protein, partial [Neisseria meningitidis]
LQIWRPEIIPFLTLPPGYRFLIGENGYEDVWFDELLLNDN